MEAIATSFALVALSEMGDKTQLLAFSLASRFRKPWTVLLGVLVATVLNHALASSVGALVASRVPPRALLAVLGVSFLAFGLWALKPDKLEGEERRSHAGAFVTTAVLFFLAEMGDKTQLATVALAARFQSIVLVTAGTTLGMLASDGLAIFLGDRLAGKVKSKWIRVAAASLFFAFGALSLWKAWELP